MTQEISGRGAPGRAGRPHPLAPRLTALLAAEAAAEAHAAGGLDPADLEQAVWVRWLEGPGPPHAPTAAWLRAAVRSEVRGARRRALREVPYGHPAIAAAAAAAATAPASASASAADAPFAAASAEVHALHGEGGRLLRAAVGRLPGRCPQLLTALLSRTDPTYREISVELGISQGSLGPLRSRCLGCLRTLLGSEG